tara:strand:- start:213 stop:437 length:225 start_codon:yes stop_codon:yes gene_type:complete
MNINDFKQHLHAVHNTLDDPSLNKQMKDRLKESPVCDMKEYKPNVMKDKSTHKPTLVRVILCDQTAKLLKEWKN